MLEPSQNTQSDDREVLVRVENVSKKFCRSLKKSLRYGVQDITSELVGRKYDHELRPDEFWALKDISFELRRGECLGLIGRNGAGKTTLLKMLNGLVKPDRGRIEMNGRVGALIALGAGFNPILTGRENIYVNASVLGLSKREISERVEEIIDFAEIGNFIDTPVQNYSSGMQVRLGFAVATTLDADILLIDEVMAVGDGNFKVKCANRILDTLKDKTVIFVSHSMENISQICTKTLVMKQGIPVYQGDVANGIAHYNLISHSDNVEHQQDTVFSVPQISQTKLSYPKIIKDGESVQFSLSFTSESSFEKIEAKLFFWNVELKPVLEIAKDNCSQSISIVIGQNRVSLGIDKIPLTPGKYTIDLHICDSLNKDSFLVRYRAASHVIVEGDRVSYAPVTLKLIRQET